MGEAAYVGEELSKARQALDDADALARADGSVEGIVNRLYYATFHAAQAALYDRNVDPGGGPKPVRGRVREIGRGSSG